MKKLIAFIIFLQVFHGYGQLSSIKFEKEYKTISVQPIKEREPSVLKDTITFRDTIYVQKQTKVKDEPHEVAFKPLVNDVFSPLPNLKITSNYGMRLHPIKRKWLFHSGVDFRAYKDTVKAVIDGVVHSSGYDSGLGNYIKVETGNYVLTYAHLSQYFLLEKMKVNAGEPLGITGNTGLSTGEHLHFSVHLNGKSIDPIGFLQSLIQIKSTLAINTTHEERSKYQTIRN